MIAVVAMAVGGVVLLRGGGSSRTGSPTSTSASPSRPSSASQQTPGTRPPSTWTDHQHRAAFPFQPLWPFANAEEAAEWQHDSGHEGHQPWHLDAAATALSFTRGYLGHSNLDRVVSTHVSPRQAWVGVGYSLPTDGRTATSAVIHLARLGTGARAPWEVVGTRDTTLTLDQPDYGSTVHSPVRVGGRITGVDENRVDFTVVYGVNHTEYRPDEHHVVSTASCTTNCVVPMATVLHRAFGIESGLMTTVHAYTGDQNLVDGPHKDPRRARRRRQRHSDHHRRGADHRSSGARAGGRLDGVAVRVPVEDGSLTDLTLLLSSAVTADDVNDELRSAAEGPLAGVLGYSAEPLVSRDIIGDPASPTWHATSDRPADTRSPLEAGLGSGAVYVLVG